MRKVAARGVTKDAGSAGWGLSAEPSWQMSFSLPAKLIDRLQFNE